MALTTQVLGDPGRDNAAFVRVDTGQSVHRLLFDCGEGCVSALPTTDARAIDHLFFSHLHMDHVAGFDGFFRRTYDRATPNHVWGPPGTGEILHHRFRGFTWNLVDGSSATWHVHDIHPDHLRTTRFELREGFAVAHPAGERERDGAVVLDSDGYTVEAYLMDHGTPSAAYAVREEARANVDAGKLRALGLAPGPWLKRVRGAPAAAGETVDVGGTPRDLAALQRELVVVTPGDSAAYLTDFRLDEPARAFLAGKLSGVGTVVCECQYSDADRELAERNMHMTAVEAAALAARAGVGRLVLFHVSDRYQADGRAGLLAEARTIFPGTDFPPHWPIPATAR